MDRLKKEPQDYQTESQAHNNALVLINTLKDQALKTKSGPTTYVVFKISRTGAPETHSFGTRKTVRKSLEEPENIRRRKEKADFKFKWEMFTKSVSEIFGAIIREFKRGS
jgi:hypothetical protein